MSTATPSLSRGMTIEEWADLDEDEPGELVDGQLEEEEMPTYVHETVVRWLLVRLSNWVEPLGGETFGSEGKLIVSQRRGRKADVSVYLPGRALPAGNLSATRRPPSIAIEVLSPRPRDVRRDRIDKAAEYAAFGVTYYWIVDPLGRTLEVRELHADGRHVSLLEASEGMHAVPGCEGLVLDLDALWVNVDKASAREDEDEG